MQDGTNTQTITRLLQERTQSKQPFFLALGLHKPRVPWTAPRRKFDLYPPAQMPRRDWLAGTNIPRIALQTEWPIGTKAELPMEGLAAYFACVSFADAKVGVVLDTLDRLDLWTSTVVVFMGDHGFHWVIVPCGAKHRCLSSRYVCPCLWFCLAEATPAGRPAARCNCSIFIPHLPSCVV